MAQLPELGSDVSRSSSASDLLAEAFSALGSGVRLAILDAIARKALECRDETRCDLSDRCCSVSELASEVGIDLSTASRHLKELRRCGLLRRRRSGRQVFYQLDGETFDLLVLQLSRFADDARAAAG